MYLLCFLVWIIFNANITVEICLFGVVIAGVIFAFSCKFLDHSLEKEKRIYKRSFQFLLYVFLLIKEIVKANLAVIKIILSEKEEVQPVVVSFPLKMKTSMGKTLMANSITLTPGTITVSLEKDQYTVHCLDDSMAEGLDSSDFVKGIDKLEYNGSDKK